VGADDAADIRFGRSLGEWYPAWPGESVGQRGRPRRAALDKCHALRPFRIPAGRGSLDRSVPPVSPLSPLPPPRTVVVRQPDQAPASKQL